MLDLSPKDQKQVLEILAKHLPGIEVRAFGSRVWGRAKRFSDLDLVVMTTQPIPFRKMGDLIEEFQESDLPIRVDIIDWALLQPEFRAVIERKYEVIQKAIK